MVSWAQRVGLGAAVVLVGLFALWPTAALADGSISGTVTDAASGARVAGIQVTLRDLNSAPWGETITAGDGSYALPSAPDGKYQAVFSGYDYETVDVPVTISGTNVTGVDPAIVRRGHITGTVTDAGGSPIRDVFVQAYAPDGDQSSFACTAADGTYTLPNLPTNTYRVEFDSTGCEQAGALNYLDQFYNDKPSLATADGVSVTDESTTSGIDARMVTAGAITGTAVAAGSNTPIQNIEVDAYDSKGYIVASTCTAADGTYALKGLASGTYRVGFSVRQVFTGCEGEQANYINQFYNAEQSLATADPVPVKVGKTTSEIDVAMAVGGQITGTVTDATSNDPLADLEVDVYDSSGKLLEYVCTAADGTYDLPSLATGSYQVGFTSDSMKGGNCPDGGSYSGFYKDKNSLAAANPVAVKAGRTTSNINDKLTPAPPDDGVINGTVTDASTRAVIPGATVTLYDSGGKEITSATTDAAGFWGASVPPGSYRVGFTAPDHIPQFYEDEPSLPSAAVISVVSDWERSNINAALAPNPGQITGTLTDGSTEQAISGATVTVYQGDLEVASAPTDATGAYLVSGLAPGSYRLAFSAPGHVSQFYNDKPSLETADLVVVSAASPTPAIDAVLAAAPSTTSTTVTAIGPPTPPAIKPPSPPAIKLPSAPAITHLRLTHRRFRTGTKLATVSRERAPVGTTFKFTVTAASTVKLTFWRLLTGRRINGRCVARDKTNQHKRSCVRSAPAGTLSYRASAGMQTVDFDGRLSRSKQLGPGTYRLTIIATDPAGHSHPRDTRFTIVK